MKCPLCPNQMEPMLSRGVTFDRCPSCSGLWFDRGEIGKFNRFDSDFPLRPDYSIHGKITKLRCPRCESFLNRVRYTPGGSLKVDRCIGCNGVWLDAGEIDTVRKLLTEKLVRRRGLRKLDEAARREQELWEAHTASVADEETEDHVSGREWLFMFLTKLPLEVHNPVRRFPGAAVSLILANALVFALQYYLGMPERFWSFAFVPENFLHFEGTYSLITSMFLHGSIFHLLGNLYFLYTFGDNVEDYLGPLRFMLLYFVCGILADVVHFVSDIHSDIPTIGASGAISGILAAYMLLFPKRKIYVFLVLWPIRVRAFWYGFGWFGLQFLNTMAGTEGIAWYGHIGGFLSGAVLIKVYLAYKNLRPATASA